MPKAKPKRKDAIAKPKSIKFPENDDEEPQQIIEENNGNNEIHDRNKNFEQQLGINDEDDDDAPEEVTFTSSKQLSTQQRETEKEARRKVNEAAKQRRATKTGTGIKSNQQLEAIDSQIRQAKQVLEQLDQMQIPEAEAEVEYQQEKDIDNYNDNMNMDNEETEYFAPEEGRVWKQIGGLNIVALGGELHELPAPTPTWRSWRRSTAELEDMLYKHFYESHLPRMPAVKFVAKGQYCAPEAFTTKTF